MDAAQEVNDHRARSGFFDHTLTGEVEGQQQTQARPGLDSSRKWIALPLTSAA
jgi:hypothetical protein